MGAKGLQLPQACLAQVEHVTRRGWGGVAVELRCARNGHGGNPISTLPYRIDPCPRPSPAQVRTRVLASLLACTARRIWMAVSLSQAISGLGAGRRRVKREPRERPRDLAGERGTDKHRKAITLLLETRRGQDGGTATGLEAERSDKRPGDRGVGCVLGRQVQPLMPAAVAPRAS